jgi:hypothetical protein
VTHAIENKERHQQIAGLMPIRSAIATSGDIP